MTNSSLKLLSKYNEVHTKEEKLKIVYEMIEKDYKLIKAQITYAKKYENLNDEKIEIFFKLDKHNHQEIWNMIKKIGAEKVLVLKNTTCIDLSQFMVPLLDEMLK